METGGPTTTRESPLQRGVVRRPPGTSPRRAERIVTHRASCSALQRARSEQLLVVAAKHGGMRERERMIEAFRPAIAHIARRYRRQAAVSWTELMQEGVVGLLRALERYDPQRGSRFWAYASWWVRQAMQQVVSELSGPVVLSDRALRQLARIKGAQRRTEQSLGREPTCRELAVAVGLPAAQVMSLMSADRKPRALEEPAGAKGADTITLGELLADPPAEDAYERVPQRLCASQLSRLFVRLSERERTVVRERYGIGTREHTLREIGVMIGVSAERVRQIERDALFKLYAAAHATSASAIA